MSKEQSNIVEYLVCVIGAFAKQFSLTNAKAYQYLRQYKGLDFLTKHYGVEHTQSIEDAVEDITIVCNRHGGALVLWNYTMAQMSVSRWLIWNEVGLQISRYQLQYIQMDELIRQLSFIRPTFQFFFRTKQSIRLLHKIDNDE